MSNDITQEISGDFVVNQFVGTLDPCQLLREADVRWVLLSFLKPNKLLFVVQQIAF